ncbi:MAG TPA: DUF1287 domain-containing protein [Flavobacterium sp.]
MIRFTAIFAFFLLAGFSPTETDFYKKLAAAAVSLADDSVKYIPNYLVINYPNGDVPKGTGVCTDYVIRAYRKVGIDLQKEVHDDMRKNFSSYPKLWGLKTTDTNIDHRRVPNLMKFFERKNSSLAITEIAKEYHPGDVVCWRLGEKLTHIGIVVDRRTAKGDRYLIAHNIGGGQVVEDCLFKFKIIGHYRYKK